MKKGVHNIPDFSRKSGPVSKDKVLKDAPKQTSQSGAPPTPKPHSTSMKSGRRGS